MMRKLCISLIGVLLLITSCAPKSEKQEVTLPESEENMLEVSIVPNYQLDDKTYKMILPFRPSKARGIIVNQLGNRLDIGEMEEGLRRHSVDVFDPDTYFYEEGQYLSANKVYDLIDRLNPKIKEGQSEEIFREQPRYFSHVLEQNYLEKNDDDEAELGGISIGVAIKSMYRFNTDTAGPFYQTVSDEDVLKEGKRVSQIILEYLRSIEGVQDVPILIGIYREEAQDSPVPGNFVAKTTVKALNMLIDDFEETNEEYILFPSEKAKKNYFDDYDIIKSFGEKISDFFPNYVGYVGEGFYEDDTLKKLSIEIPIQFNGNAEVVGFTQYIYGLVKNMFPNHYDLEIQVKSDNEIESLIYWEKGEEDPVVHVFH